MGHTHTVLVLIQVIVAKIDNSTSPYENVLLEERNGNFTSFHYSCNNFLSNGV